MGGISASASVPVVSAGTARYLYQKSGSTLSTSIVKLFGDYVVTAAGTIKTRLGLLVGNGGGGPLIYGAVYKNGSQIGSLNSTTNGATWVYFDLDVAVVPGDYFSFYGYCANPTFSCQSLLHLMVSNISSAAPGYEAYTP